MNRHIYGPFLSTDELRPIMCNVFYDGEYANATNAHIAIRWKDKTGEINPKAPNVKAIFDGFKCESQKVFSAKEYDKWKDNLPLVKELIPCDDCDGDGQVEWNYNHHTKMDDCPECDGKGGTLTRNMVPDPNINYPIGFFTYSQVNLDKIERLMGMCKVDFVDVNIDDWGRGIVKIDPYEILILPIIRIQ